MNDLFNPASMAVFCEDPGSVKENWRQRWCENVIVLAASSAILIGFFNFYPMEFYSLAEDSLGMDALLT
mgnify:FL=1